MDKFTDACMFTQNGHSNGQPTSFWRFEYRTLLPFILMTSTNIMKVLEGICWKISLFFKNTYFKQLCPFFTHHSWLTMVVSTSLLNRFHWISTNRQSTMTGNEITHWIDLEMTILSPSCQHIQLTEENWAGGGFMVQQFSLSCWETNYGAYHVCLRWTRTLGKPVCTE